MKKYRILWDYRTEGHTFHNIYEKGKEGKIAEYETVEQAVKEAIALNYSTPFLIVQVIDWEAKENNPS